MSFQRPIFENGLFGKANRFVCNTWTDSAEMVANNAEGIRWAQEQLAKASTPERWLAKITAASLLAPNRWEYTFEPFTYNVARNPVQLLTGTFGAGTLAVNIRETRNSATTVDGSPLPTGTSIGPVGSSYVAGAWVTTSLAGYVEMHADYDSVGAVLYWFDAPNPTRCGT